MRRVPLKVKLKPRFRFHFMIFKVKFQALFNPELAENTACWLTNDLQENLGKYFKVRWD